MKIILAYSGGLDTSVAIRWLAEKYDAEIVAAAVDVGEVKDYPAIREKALDVGAVSSHILDAKDEFVHEFIFPCLKANAMYENDYPLATAMARPLISQKIVEVAASEKADAVAHGSTGKGNDQVRFEVAFAALNPNLRIVAPARDWGMTREEEIEYAKEHDIPVPVTVENPFSIDENLWGRSVETGVLEDPTFEPPEEAFEWTTPPAAAPDEAEYVTIGFECGVPVSLNESPTDPVSLIAQLNVLGGKHGVGRIDMIESRLVGIKSREVYEAPAATILLTAHRDLERLTIERDTLHFKAGLELKYAELVYYGLWFHPLREALDSFMNDTQKTVTGEVRIKLFKGSCTAVGRSSPSGLYQYALATYDKADAFDHHASEGFIKIFGLPSKLSKAIERERQ